MENETDEARQPSQLFSYAITYANGDGIGVSEICAECDNEAMEKLMEKCGAKADQVLCIAKTAYGDADEDAYKRDDDAPCRF